MLSEVAHVIGQRFHPGAIGLCPPNHPVVVLIWSSISKLLAGHLPEGRCRSAVSPAASEIENMRSFPFDFEANAVHVWDAAFVYYRSDSAEISS